MRPNFWTLTIISALFVIPVNINTMTNEVIFGNPDNRFQPYTGVIRTLAILILAGGLLSCKDDEVLPLTPNLVNEVKAYDLDNNSNSSDIRVDFEVKNNVNVFEYRVMVIPSNTSSSFTESLAASIPETSYSEVNPESFTLEYSIKRLPSNILDINGNPIINGIEYVVAVFVFTSGNYQLSGFSKPFTLKNQGIYNGRYILGAEQTCLDINDIPTFASISPDSSSIFIVDLNEDGNDYFGIFPCPRCVDPNDYGPVRFTVAGTTITNWIWDLKLIVCWHSSLCNHEDLCPGIEYGEGRIIDDLSIEIDYTNVSCKSTCSGTNFLVRQN